MSFSHERLDVYQVAVEFVAWSQPLVEALPRKVSARDQLERASTSIPLNIAEGNAKFSRRDRARYLQIALGSALECAAILDVLVARRLRSAEEVADGKVTLERLAAMIMALLRRLGSTVAEEEAAYRSSIEDEDEDEGEDEGEGEGEGEGEAEDDGEGGRERDDGA